MSRFSSRISGRQSLMYDLHDDYLFSPTILADIEVVSVSFQPIVGGLQINIEWKEIQLLTVSI